MYTYIHTYTCIHIYTYIYICRHTIHIYIYTYNTHIYIYAYIQYIYIYTYNTYIYIYTLVYHSTPRKRPVLLQLCAGCEMAVLAHCLERLSSVAWWPEFSIDNGPAVVRDGDFP